MSTSRSLAGQQVDATVTEKTSIELQQYREIFAKKASLPSVLKQVVELNLAHTEKMQTNWQELFSFRKDAENIATALQQYLKNHHVDECRVLDSQPQLFATWIASLKGCHAVNARIDKTRNKHPGDAWLKGEFEAISILDAMLSQEATPSDIFSAMIVLAISASLGSSQALSLVGEFYYASCYLKHSGRLSKEQQALPAFKAASITLGHWDWGTSYFNTAQKCMSASRYIAIALGNSFTDTKKSALIYQQGLGNILSALQYFYIQFMKVPQGIWFSTKNYLNELEVIGCDVSAIVVTKLQSQTEFRVSLFDAISVLMDKEEGEIYLFDLTQIASAIMKLQHDTSVMDAEALSQAIQKELNQFTTEKLLNLNHRLNSDRVYRVASSSGPISFALATLSSASDLCLYDRGAKRLDEEGETKLSSTERHYTDRNLLPIDNSDISVVSMGFLPSPNNNSENNNTQSLLVKSV